MNYFLKNNLNSTWKSFDPSQVIDNLQIHEGEYLCNIDQVLLTINEILTLKWKLRILKGDFKNKILWKNNLIFHKKSLRLLKLDLYTCGINLENFSDLKERYKELEGSKIHIKVIDDGKYKNINLIRVKR